MFGIPVTLFAGAGGYYFVDFQGKLCARDKVFKLGIIPGAWIAVHVGASVSLWIVEAGITIEARLLETYLVPGETPQTIKIIIIIIINLTCIVLFLKNSIALKI